MRTIFEYSDYKSFVLDRIQNMPKRGRGELQRIATSLRMHSTTISQVFRGHKDLTREQAAGLCLHFGMTDLETDYFLNLVDLSRAGSKELTQITEKRLASIRSRAQNISDRITKDRVLSHAEKSEFYSNWYYSAIRLLTDLPEYRNVDRIAERLDLPLRVVNEALRFLLETGLCIDKSGSPEMGPKRTFIENTSPLIARHHTNWRLQSVERSTKIDLGRDLMLTAPMTLSNRDADKIRSLLLEVIEQAMKINTASPSEDLRCLCIDWFRV